MTGTWRWSAIGVALVLAGCSGASTTPTTVPTVPTSAVASPDSSSPTTTPTPTPAPEPTPTSEVGGEAPIVEWLLAQQALGRDQVLADPAWATRAAVTVVAFTQRPTIAGDLVVALADGRAVPIPAEMRALLPVPPTAAPDIRVVTPDGGPLVVFVAADGRTVLVDRLDPTDLTWTSVTGVAPLSVGERLDLSTAGAYVLLVHTDTTVVGESRQWGQMVAPDGTVRAMASPPADVPIWFTDDAGGRALLLGFDTAAGLSPDLLAPMAFDPTTNEWLTVPSPAWLSCPDHRCVWSARHEQPDPQFSVTTPAGVVVVLPDGSYGLLDPVAFTWRRLDDPPFAVPGPVVALVGTDRLVLLPGPASDGTQRLGTALWLELAPGTWTSEVVVDVSGQAAPVWWETRWWGDVLLVGADSDEVGNPPRLAIDLTTGATRPPTTDELRAWPALAGQAAIADVIDAWRLRAAG